jgi:2-keto-4-pentenoate hydratase/2-oxohepta-3-ene-1,7-dioic acid hydratase in catechol pathway
MRLLMYRDDRGSHLGALRGGEVVDLPALAAAQGRSLPNDLLALIDLGPDGLELARNLIDHDPAGHTVPLNAVRLLAPLNPPRGNVLAIGRNYEEHAAESARAHAEEIQPPTVFTKAQTAINDPDADVIADPAVTSQLDYEAELGVVIGARALNVGADRALDHVFGYTVVNDISARDVQYGWGGQFFKGKSLDGFCPVGPWIVTADEIPDPQRLRVRLRVNGETRQDAGTDTMIHSVAQIIERLSLGMTLLPGSLIATGTPAGVGMGRTPPEYLKPGDVVEAEVDAIGVLRSRIAAPDLRNP